MRKSHTETQSNSVKFIRSYQQYRRKAGKAKLSKPCFIRGLKYERGFRYPGRIFDYRSFVEMIIKCTQPTAPASLEWRQNKLPMGYGQEEHVKSIRISIIFRDYSRVFQKNVYVFPDRVWFPGMADAAESLL